MDPSFFRDVVLRREKHSPSHRGRWNTVIRFQELNIRPDEVVAITGETPEMGEWKRCIPLDDNNFPIWEARLEVKRPFEYKFVVAHRQSLRILRWETGFNHKMDFIPDKGERITITDIKPDLQCRPWKGAGTAVPVFSLRTNDSFGIGEFHDIRKLIDWAAATGQSIIQLLPINDTSQTGSWTDSYPYNAISAFALHPQFLHLPSCGVVEDGEYISLKESLNSLKAVDYEKVNSAKERLLRKAFASNGKTDLESAPYKRFYRKNSRWLAPYAAFCTLRDGFGTADFSKWDKYSRFCSSLVRKLFIDRPEDMLFHCWKQYHLDRQLKDVVEYAHSRRIALKGDIPIGISQCSTDVWQAPHLFHRDSQAGAPPDFFSEDGQNWGFPTYDWEAMAKDGFSWWKARMKKMGEYFDAYRIDHILGFFRIWEIPKDVGSGALGHFNPAIPYSGKELSDMGFAIPSDGLFVKDPRRKGYWHPCISGFKSESFNNLPQNLKDTFAWLHNDFFYHRHNDFWKASAKKKLPILIKSSQMLPCGEDLGMVPDCVPGTMRELGILSLKIQRMPQRMEDEFADTWSYPYMSVCATGTHDTSTLRAWWEENPEVTGRFYHNVLHCDGPTPAKCVPWICEKILRMHIQSPSMLCILPLQDWLSMDGDIRYQGDPADERINVPAIPRYNWKWRMHINLEDLLSCRDFNERLKELILSSS